MHSAHPACLLEGKGNSCCLSLCVCASRSPMPDERRVSTAVKRVKVTFRCAPLALAMPLKGTGYNAHTSRPTVRPSDRPTDQPYREKNVRHVKYDTPGQKRYYAHKIFILRFRIYQFDVCAPACNITSRDSARNRSRALLSLVSFRRLIWAFAFFLFLF